MAVSRLLRLVLLAVASTGSVASAEDAAPYNARIDAFLSRPDQIKVQSMAVEQAWGSAAGRPCEEIRISTVTPTVPAPITFDDAGTPLRGSWKHTIEAKGCGQSMKLNLFYVADGSGNVKRITGAPGTTRADLVLQHDSVPYLLAGASPRISRDCKQIQLIDTEYKGTESGEAQGGQGSPWLEYWTLSGCGASARVTMHFTPGATGTTINVKPTETVPATAQ